MSLYQLMWLRKRRPRCSHCDAWRSRVNDVLICWKCDKGDMIADKIVRGWLAVGGPPGLDVPVFDDEEAD